MHIALHDQGLPVDVEVKYVRVGSSCAGIAVLPRLVAGAQFTVCVIRYLSVPAVPEVLSGKGITTVGKYVVHVDD